MGATVFLMTVAINSKMLMLKLTILSLLFLQTTCFSIANTKNRNPPHQKSLVPPYQTTLELIAEQGYATEKHTVESDGYQLELHRIITTEELQGVVIMNHG